MNTAIAARMQMAGVSPVCLGEVPYAGRLMKPSEKVVSRIVREAMRSVSRFKKTSFDDVENAFLRTRHEVSHLIAHEHYPDSMKKFISDLNSLHNKISDLRAMKDAPPLDYVKIEFLFGKIHTCFDAEMKKFTFTQKDIVLYIEVVDAARVAAKIEGYDPEMFVPVSHYKLATMMIGNFEAYRKTLE